MKKVIGFFLGKTKIGKYLFSLYLKKIYEKELYYVLSWFNDNPGGTSSDCKTYFFAEESWSYQRTAYFITMCHFLGYIEPKKIKEVKL